MDCSVLFSVIFDVLYNDTSASLPYCHPLSGADWYILQGDLVGGRGSHSCGCQNKMEYPPNLWKMELLTPVRKLKVGKPPIFVVKSPLCRDPQLKQYTLRVHFLNTRGGTHLHLPTSGLPAPNLPVRGPRPWMV